jgi:hypothetical protein
LNVSVNTAVATRATTRTGELRRGIAFLLFIVLSQHYPASREGCDDATTIALADGAGRELHRVAGVWTGSRAGQALL